MVGNGSFESDWLAYARFFMPADQSAFGTREIHQCDHAVRGKPIKLQDNDNINRDKIDGTGLLILPIYLPINFPKPTRY